MGYSSLVTSSAELKLSWGVSASQQRGIAGRPQLQPAPHLPLSPCSVAVLAVATALRGGVPELGCRGSLAAWYVCWPCMWSALSLLGPADPLVSSAQPSQSFVQPQLPLLTKSRANTLLVSSCNDYSQISTHRKGKSATLPSQATGEPPVLDSPTRADPSRSPLAGWALHG